MQKNRHTQINIRNIHDLVSILNIYNNHTKFQPNWIRFRTYNLQLKLLDAVVTLKYGQGNGKWHSPTKLSEYLHCTKFDL